MTICTGFRDGARRSGDRSVPEQVRTVARGSARCMVLGTVACTDSPAIQSYARARGRRRGIAMTTATINSDANRRCGSMAAMNRVTISLPYRSPTSLLPIGPTALTATACYPSIV